MPANKNFVARTRVINVCLSHSPIKYWTIEALMARIEEKTGNTISKRTVQSDIEKMQKDVEFGGYNAPIKFSKEKEGYHYTESDFSIDNLPLTEDDIQALEFATTTLSQYKNVKFLNEFVGTVDKLIHLVNQLKYTNYESHFEFIDFEKAPYSKGTEYLDALIGAIKKRRVVEIVYRKFEDSSKIHILSPYLLKEYRNRWYLLGLGTYDGKERITTLALDRISKVEEIENGIFVEQQNFNKELFFKHTIGINYLDGNPLDIILSFTPYQGNYIKTQYLHETQEVLVDNDDEFRIKLSVVPNYELCSIILSYGKEVRIISPATFRDEIAEIISESHANYCIDSTADNTLASQNSL